MQAADIDEVIQQLEEIVTSQIEAGSPLGYFPALYHTVTVAVKEGIRHGFFEDGPRMAKLDTVFANRYLEAYHQFRTDQHCTASWRLAFEAGGNHQLIVLQHLFLGMSAHINLDLGIAAAEVCPGAQITSLEKDFFKINVVLGTLVEGVQKDLAKIWPLMSVLDWFAGRLDESLADFSMNIARDGAWKVACELAEIPGDAERAAYVQNLDSRVYQFGKRIERPGWLLSALLRPIRWTERGDVSSRIRHLF